MQDEISELVAAANKLGLQTVRLSVTRPNGQKESNDLSIEKIGKNRSLQ